MIKDEYIKNYAKFKSLVSQSKREEKNADTLREVMSHVDKHFKEVLAGFIINRLEKNILKETNRAGEPFTFVSGEYEIVRKLADPAFPTRIKDLIQEKMLELAVSIPPLTEQNYNSQDLFKVEVLFDSYSNTRQSFIYYYDHEDLRITNGYIDIYRSTLLPALWDLYSRPNVNRQVNPERFQICAEGNFKPDSALNDISFENIEKLIHRFITGVQEGRKLLAEEEIVLCYKVLIVQTIIRIYQKNVQHKNGKAGSAGGPKNVIQQAEDEVRKAVVHLLRGSIKQGEYTGFFTKEDFVDFLAKKYSTVPRERIISIFDSETWPKPPSGVTRFHVPATKEHGELNYFTCLENIPSIFQNFQYDKKKKFDVQSHISERHFLFFMERMFKDFKSAGYSNQKISGLLKCSPEMVTHMMNTVAKLSS